MGADNWTYCPKCKRDAEEVQEKAILKAGKSYGKVTPEKYIEMVQKANTPIELSSSLREDYFLTTSMEGEFSVEYTASCQCGFRFSFKHAEQALAEKEAK